MRRTKTVPPSPSSASTPLARPVTDLRGVGPERAGQLARLGIRTIEELLLHRPKRYEDRRVVGRIAELELRKPGSTSGRIVAQGVKTWKKGTRSVFEIVLEDGSGRLHCRWWNLPYMEQYFHVGDTVVVYGRPCSLRPRTIDHPETEVIEQGEETSVHLNRIVPVYPLTEGLTQRWLRSLVWQALERVGGDVAEPWPDMPDPGQLPRAAAIRQVHFPDELVDAETARRRLALDEFVAFQIPLQRRRRNLRQHAKGLPCGGNNRLIRPFLQRLNFKLTDAQTRVLRELRNDLSGAHPMRRLLQGDVGCGKTVVAACAALMAVESGYNVAVMVPTEILAEQHTRTFARWFEPLGIPVVLRTRSHKQTTQNGPVLADLGAQCEVADEGNNGSPGLFIGTHALIEEGFAVDELGLVIIDEQHRFGVAQRERLVRKGRHPHLLVMTATPIPRTLGLTLYGDLDLSLIDAEPPGRGRVRTFVRSAASLSKVWAFVAGKVDQGRQAYVVCPRIEEDGLVAGTTAAMREYETVQRSLAPRRVGLLHGRMCADEKDAVMGQFRSGAIKVLVATSVIEVGVDVPNATVMVIENADVFGLAQLHQLRGRIRRSAHEAYCILVASARTAAARERLNVLERTTDGFRIAEADLELRGPGEMLGLAQSGVPAFKFGDLAKDIRLIEKARARAARLVVG